MKPAEFWALTFREFHNHIEAHRLNEVEKWKRTRLQAWIVYAANSDSKDRKTIEEWMPLGDERPRPARRLMNRKQWEYMKKNW